MIHDPRQSQTFLINPKNKNTKSIQFRFAARFKNRRRRLRRGCRYNLPFPVGSLGYLVVGFQMTGLGRYIRRVPL